MSWEIVWTEHAQRDMRHLNREVASRVLRAVNRFAETERGDLRKLGGEDEEWALRVGVWRVRFSYDRERNAVILLQVLPRRDVYRR